MANGDKKLSNHVASGEVLAATPIADIRVICGFKPSYVKVISEGLAQEEWIVGMGAGYAQKIVDSGAGTTDISNITTLGITVEYNGFVIGQDTDIQTAGDVIRWVAFK